VGCSPTPNRSLGLANATRSSDACCARPPDWPLTETARRKGVRRKMLPPPAESFQRVKGDTRLYPRIIPRQAMSRPRIFMRARRGATDSAKCFAPARGPELAVGCDATLIIYSTSRSSLSDAKMVASNSGKFGGRGRGRENIDWKPAPPLRQQSHLGNIAGASMPCRATCGGAAFGARPF
jgi:hypothetical protein